MVYVLVAAIAVVACLVMLGFHLIDERIREAMWRAYQQGKTGRPLR